MFYGNELKRFNFFFNLDIVNSEYVLLGSDLVVVEGVGNFM